MKNNMYEIKPGIDALAYTKSWYRLNKIAKQASKNKYKFFLDVTSGLDRAILNVGAFEKVILDIIKRICIQTNHTDELVDIGSNIGNHSIYLSNIFDKVSAIEPNPVIFKILQANIMRNNINNVIAHNFGLAEKKSKATLVSTSENHSLGKVKELTKLGANAFNITESEYNIAHEIELESTKTFFESYLNKDKKIFIKIDVEGMEELIIKNLIDFINKDQPIIGFEWYVNEQIEIKNIINELKNYDVYTIESNEKEGANVLLKFAHLLMFGRKFTIKKYDQNNLKKSYPMVILSPNKYKNLFI